MANIKDIAKMCGVNPATVSRALNGQKGVSAAMRDKIVLAAQKLSYSKNPLAASLITRHSVMIGLVVPDITNPYYAYVAKGVSQVLDEAGYVIFLCDCDRKKELEKKYFEKLCSYRVEGVILLSLTATEEDLQIFFDQGIRVVCVDNHISKKVSTVCNDNYQGACDLAEHLITDCHSRKVVAVMGSPDAMTTINRLRGYKDTFAAHGLDKSIEVMTISSTYEEGYKVAPLALAKNPDTIIAINDTVALGIFAYCQQHNIKIPDDVRLAGYDDIEEAAMISVPLTTVHQRKYVLGQKAATQLLQELEDKDPTPIRIELLPKLMVRASCGELSAHNS